MNTLDIINNVLTSFGKPILKEHKQVENKKPKELTFTINVDPKYVIFKDPVQEKEIESKETYVIPSIEIKEIDNSIIEKPKKETKRVKTILKTKKPKKVSKSIKNK